MLQILHFFKIQIYLNFLYEFYYSPKINNLKYYIPIIYISFLDVQFPFVYHPMFFYIFFIVNIQLVRYQKHTRNKGVKMESEYSSRSFFSFIYSLRWRDIVKKNNHNKCFSETFITSPCWSKEACVCVISRCSFVRFSK